MYIGNVTERMESVFGCKLKKFKTPMEVEYHPELDDFPFISPKRCLKIQRNGGKLQLDDYNRAF